MNLIPQILPEVILIEPAVFGDARGFFVETWSQRRYAEAGIDALFVQDNVSLSRMGILRGLHLQYPNSQGKLVQVLSGEVFDVAVDVRQGSPNFGKSTTAYLSAENHRQFWIPPGFAHGFLVTSETALFQYKCTAYYSPADELSIRWDDPDLGIEWPMKDPILSGKDSSALCLKDVPESRLPAYKEVACSAS